MNSVEQFAREKVVRFVVGLKNDLTSSRTVQYETAEAFAQKHNMTYLVQIPPIIMIIIGYYQILILFNRNVPRRITTESKKCSQKWQIVSKTTSMTRNRVIGEYDRPNTSNTIYLLI
jgi:hypothetical protein